MSHLKQDNMEQSLQGYQDQWKKEEIQMKQSKSHPLYQVNWYPITTSPWIASVAFIYIIFFLIHIVNFYYTIYGKIYNQVPLFQLTSMLSMSLAPLGYVCSIILYLFTFLGFFYNDPNEEGFKYLIAWIGSRIFPSLRYIIQLNLIISSVFFIGDNPSGGFFVVSAFLNLFVTFFCQNYSLRKDYLCCKSVLFMMMFKIAVIFGYFLNCLGLRTIISSSQFLAFLIIHFVISSILMIVYFIYGYLMYRYTTPKYIFMASLSLYFSMSLSMLYDQCLRRSNSNSNSQYIVYQSIFFIFIFSMNYNILSSMRRNGVDKSQKNIKKKIYFLFSVLQQSSQSLDDDCQIRGILRHHIKNTCQNLNCFINRNKPIYDSKKNKECSINKINQGKTSLTKFLMKCLYQQKLEQCNWKDTDLVLQYVEFVYLKLKNVFNAIHLIDDLQTKYLTPFQKIRLERLKKVMNQQNDKINKELYFGNLDIENIIKAQAKFQQVKDQIAYFLRKNILFWKYVQKNSIDLSQMSSIIQPNFELIQKINNNWKPLAKYFQIQKRWKFYYVCYTLYLKNQKVKPQFLEYFGLNVHEDDLFNHESCHIDKTTQQEKLFNSKMIFESNTCFIHINSHTQKSIIKQVSKYFTKMFKYEKGQILESSIETLMPPSLKKIHQDAFVNWAGQGKSNNQSAFQVKKVFPIAKNGYTIPVYKFYKQVLTIDSSHQYDLHYVGMFKKNKEEEFVAILNQNFQIQAMTEALANKLKIREEQNEIMKRLNFLMFCPSLLKFTKFQSQILKVDQDFKRDDNSKKFTVSQQVSNANNEKQKRYSKVLQQKKELTQSNCKMMISTDLKTTQEYYKKGKKKFGEINNEAIYHGIRQGYYFIKKSKANKKFKSQVQIKQRNYNKSCYYQVYFRDIQESLLGNKIQEKEQIKYEQIQNIKESVVQQDFHLFFQSSNNSHSVSLAFSNNIFIKQDNNKPVQMISHVSSITITVRIFFVIFMILSIGTFFIQNSNSTNILSRGQKLAYVTEFQLQNYQLQVYHYSQIAQIHLDQHSIIEKSNFTQSILALKENYFLKKAILDQTLNPYQLYTPYYFKSNFLTPSYDQIELVDKLMEKIISLQATKDANITLKNTQFADYDNYMIPSFNLLIEKTKINLNDGFQSIFNNSKILTIVLYCVQTILLFVGFFVVLTRLINISNSFIALMEIFTQLNESDVKKIYRYAEFTTKLFVHLNEKDNIMSEIDYGGGMKPAASLQQNSSLKADQQIEEQVQNANLNKKIKKVQIGQQLTNIKVKAIIFIIIFLIFYGISSFGLNIFISTSSKTAQNYKNSGYNSLFQYIPNMEITLIGMLQKYVNPNQFNYTRYANTVENFQKMKSISVTQSQTSKFDIMYHDIFFDNFCLIYPNVIHHPDLYDQCRLIAENTLQHGVQSFFYYMNSDVQNLLIPDSVHIPYKNLQNNDLAVKIIGYYLLSLIQVWKVQFQEIISTYQSHLLLICICLILFQVIIYIILVQIFIVGNLEAKYQTYKKIYINYMPDFVVSKEKIIKAKLHVEGFLEK